MRFLALTMALILRISRSCIRFFSSDVIQGELRARTRIVLRGGHFCQRFRETTFSMVTTYHIRISWTVYLVPTMRRNIITKIFPIEFSKIPISYYVVPSWCSIDGQFPIGKDYAMTMLILMWQTPEHIILSGQLVKITSIKGNLHFNKKITLNHRK